MPILAPGLKTLEESINICQISFFHFLIKYIFSSFNSLNTGGENNDKNLQLGKFKMFHVRNSPYHRNKEEKLH